MDGSVFNLTFKAIGTHNFFYKWTCIYQCAESVEVIEQRSCIINDEMNFGNSFIIWGNVAVPKYDIVGKDACRVIYCFSSGMRA